MRYVVSLYGKDGGSTGSRVVELQPWQVALYLEQQISDGHHGATAEPSGSRPAGHIRWKDGWWPPVGSDLRTVLQSVYLSIV
jgi:hypothetical protein